MKIRTAILILVLSISFLDTSDLHAKLVGTVVGGTIADTEKGQRIDGSGNVEFIGDWGTSAGFVLDIYARNALLRDNTGSPTNADGIYNFWGTGTLGMVNTSGIIFGTTAQVNAANVIISTLNINSDNFFNPVDGKRNFYRGGDSAFIYNAGRIAARPGGYVALLSQAINNSGTIQVSSLNASIGKVVLAVGERMTVSLDDKSQISVTVDEKLRDTLKIMGPDGKPIDSAIKNSGDILAEGGKVELTAKVLNKIFDYAVNNTGVIQATSLINNNGIVELVAEGPSPVLNTGTIEAGSIKVSVTGSDFVNRGYLNAKIVSGSKIGGDIDIKASDLIIELGKKISADRLVTIDVDAIIEVVYAPDDTAIAASEYEIVSSGEVISAPTVSITMRKLGSSDSPVYIKSANLYIKRLDGNIDILESTGIGTSVLMRGPPEGFGSFLYSKDSNLTLDASRVELIGSAPVNFYGNITFNNFICAVPAKEIYFEAGKTYIFMGALKIQGAYAQHIKLLSSEAGKEWYIDPRGDRDLTYIWVADSRNLNPSEIILNNESTDRGNTMGWDPTRTWSGGSGNWNDPAKWSGGVTPGAGDDVVIVSGGIVSYNIASSTVLSLTVNSGGRLNFDALTGNSLTVIQDVTNNGTIAVLNKSGSNSHTLNIAGSFTNNGTFTASAGSGSSRDYITVVFNGSSDTQSIGGSSATTFRNLTVSNANGVILNSNITISGTRTLSGGAKFRILVTATGVDKVYNGAATATVTLSINKVSGDTVNIGYAGALFPDKNAGVDKVVSVTGISISGGDAGDYALASTTASTAADITPKELTVTGITAGDKVYDGTTAATLNAGSAVLSGVISGDAVILDMAGVSGIFSDKNVHNNKTVAVSGLTISGGDSSNYSITQPTAKADITARPITVTAVTDTKVYDRTTSSSVVPVITSGSLAAGDTVVWTQTFNSRNAGVGKTLTPSGTVSDGNRGRNYSVTFVKDATGVIDPKPLTVTGITAINREYDGTTDATLNTVSAALSGVLSGDSVTLNKGGAIGAFIDENAGAGKTVTISGLTIGGGTSNYTLVQPATIADVTQRPITVTAAADTKIYDGTVASAGMPSITAGSLVPGDTAAWIQVFDSKNAGSGKALVPSGTVSDGNAGNNYSVTFVEDATGIIDPKPITVTGITAFSKIYDGTTDVGLYTDAAGTVGVMPGDDLNLITGGAKGVFDNADIGTGKTVTVSGIMLGGADSGNYALSAPQALAAADIVPVPLLSLDTVLFFSIMDQSSSLNAPRYPLPDSGGFYIYQPNTFNPQVGQVYFYHPLTPYDMAAFDAMILDANAYQFMNGSLTLIGHAGLTSMFEELGNRS
jgi:filamentous hemagglutinin family protein